MSAIGVEAKPLSRPNIRRFATDVRGALGYANLPYIEIEPVLDFVLPRALPGFAYGVGTMKEMGNNHGLAFPDRSFILLREDVFERACNGEGRDRMTVCHEIGHVLLHAPDRIVMRRAEGSPKTYCDPEWQAKSFAGELLVAHTMIKQFPTPLEAALAFGVSLDAAELQLRKFREDGLL
jgi:hypothetical protein